MKKILILSALAASLFSCSEFEPRDFVTYEEMHGNNSTGNWCVDYTNKECSKDPYLLESRENCAGWWGVLLDDCPKSYYKWSN